MYSRKKSRWLKHLDFMILDIISVCLSLSLAYGLRHGFDSVYARSEYMRIGVLMIMIDILLVFFRNSYQDVIRRGYLKELGAASAHFSLIMTGVLLYLFAMQRSELYSRLTLFWTWGIGMVLMYLFRISLKTWLRKRMMQRNHLVSVLAVVSSDTAKETMRTGIRTAGRKLKAFPWRRTAVTLLIISKKMSWTSCLSASPVIFRRRRISCSPASGWGSSCTRI